MLIRQARTDEALALTQLAWAAKAYWGYSQAVMERWRDELRLTPESIARKPTWVAQCSPTQTEAGPNPDPGAAGRVAAVLQLGTDGSVWEIDCLWVHPDMIGQGLGRALMAEAADHARQACQTCLRIDADPHAEGFYLALGAIRSGRVPAPLPGDPGRYRPQLLLPVHHSNKI